MPQTDHTADRADVRITGLKAMQLYQTFGTSLVKIETDAGFEGYGEAGADGPTVRSQLQQMEELLLGENPVEIEKLFDRMTSLQHPSRPHVPTVSGVDIALWDLAGKILGLPVSRMLSGQFREEIPFYFNDEPEDLLDPECCREWAERIKNSPDRPKAIKLTFEGVIDRNWSQQVPRWGKKQQPLSKTELEQVREAAENVRDALGEDLDFIAHCHNEWDVSSAKGLAEAIAPAKPLWLEDPLPVGYSNNWRVLRRDAPIPVLTGEKLELRREFQPFIENAAVDVVQPDLAFSGGITGSRKIAELADLHHLPVTTHNVSSLVLNVASVHFGASVRNFWMTETRMTQSEQLRELGESEQLREMGDVPGLEINDGTQHVPDGDGLGITLDEEVLQESRVDDEPYWD